MTTKKATRGDTQQARAIASLTTGSTTAQAAQDAGVTQRTVQRWLSGDITFIAALHQAEASAIDVAARRLSALAADAVDVLRSVMDDENVSAAVKVRAAEVALSALLKLREFMNLEKRVEELEKHHAQK